MNDAWGNIISETNATGGTPTSLAQKWSDINPFRYRGYYYDAETGLYYLQSRYYDAETGRFLNSDVLLDTSDLLGFNTFAYCGNNPIAYVDYSGRSYFECCPNNNCFYCQKARNADSATTDSTTEIVPEIKGDLDGLLKTTLDAFSFEAGAGFGMGLAVEYGLVSIDALFKGNPVHFVITSNDEERGIFSDVDLSLAMQVFIFEIYIRDNARTRLSTFEDVSKGPLQDIRIIDDISYGGSFYFFIGVEFEFSYDAKAVLDYIATM